MTTQALEDSVESYTLDTGNLSPRNLYVLYEIFCREKGIIVEEGALDDIMNSGWEDFRNKEEGFARNGLVVYKKFGFISARIDKRIAKAFVDKAIEYLRLDRASDGTDPMTLLYGGKRTI